MKGGRAVWFWFGVIGLLLVVEIAEITRLFTLPIVNAVTNVLSFIFALVFTTIVAFVGAVFIGIYLSHRMQAPGGFTPFEEEMLKMRVDIQTIRKDVEELRRPSVGPSDPPTDPNPSRGRS